VRPPSPVGQALDAVLHKVYEGNHARLAQALGVSRPTLYDWLTKPKPRIDNPRHRQAIAEVTQLDQRSIDMLIVNGLGYHLAPVRAEAVTLAVLVSKLDADDISNLERQALAMLRRDAELRKGRRGKSTPAP
jgi:hypothetical protein